MTTLDDGDLGLVDEVAALLLAADDGDNAAERELSDRYAEDHRLHPGERIVSRSPTGTHRSVDLRTRESSPVDLGQTNRLSPA